MKELKLEEGEVICSRCDGNGHVPSNYGSMMSEGGQITCPKCWGDGKLDWISNAMGERPRESIPTNGNVFIGYKAGYNITTENYQICIGDKS